MPNFHSFLKRKVYRLNKPFKAAANYSRQFWKSMRALNLYLGPLQIIERILGSEMIFMFPVVT